MNSRTQRAIPHITEDTYVDGNFESRTVRVSPEVWQWLQANAQLIAIVLDGDQQRSSINHCAMEGYYVYRWFIDDGIVGQVILSAPLRCTPCTDRAPRPWPYRSMMDATRPSPAVLPPARVARAPRDG